MVYCKYLEQFKGAVLRWITVDVKMYGQGDKPASKLHCRWRQIGDGVWSLLLESKRLQAG
jgi:hypothetical protein